MAKVTRPQQPSSNDANSQSRPDVSDLFKPLQHSADGETLEARNRATFSRTETKGRSSDG